MIANYNIHFWSVFKEGDLVRYDMDRKEYPVVLADRETMQGIIIDDSAASFWYSVKVKWLTDRQSNHPVPPECVFVWREEEL